MKLSDEQFQQVLASLGCGNERLITPNKSLIITRDGTKTSIIPCSQNANRTVTPVGVLRLSDLWIQISHSTPLRTGDNFILPVPSSNFLGATALLCTVVNAQRTLQGAYAIHATFTRVLTTGPSAPQFAPPEADLDNTGLAHLREVEGRLSKWTT